MTDLAHEVERLAPWYHTFELPSGVVTKGYFDLRSVVGKLPLPGSLAGKRCLDAAACEGFWSFELARRGGGRQRRSSVHRAAGLAGPPQREPAVLRRGAGQRALRIRP